MATAVNKPPFDSEYEREHRRQISTYTRDCLHRVGHTPFVGLAGEALSPAQIGANQNDYAPGDASILRLDASAAYNITGIVASFPGQFLFIFNVGSFTINLTNQDVLSVAANRIITGTGGTVAIAADGTAALWYDDTTARWRKWA